MEVRLESTNGVARTAEVWVDGHLLVVMDEYSRPGEEITPGELTDVKFTYLTEEGFTWEQAVRANPGERRIIEPIRGWRYVGYGQVVQIMPVVIDFGLLRMADANWSRDESLVGKFVKVSIDRLSMARATEEDWPEEVLGT